MKFYLQPHFFLIIVLTSLFFYRSSPGQVFEWSTPTQGEGNAVTYDLYGNAYVTGTSGTWPATYIFVTKYNPDGKVIWTRQAGGSGFNAGQGITVDASGNVYVTGFFRNTATFGTINITATGGDVNIFVAKYSSSGDCLWVKQTGGTGYTYGEKIKVAPDGNIVVTGYIQNTTQFDSFVLNCSGTDIFAVKYNPAGNVIWAQRAGLGPYAYGTALDIDNAGNIYIAGKDNGTFYLVKFDKDGNKKWDKRSSGSGTSVNPEGIAVDPNGNLLVAGYFGGRPIFDSYTLSGNGMDDIFLVKFNSLGAVVWAKSWGGANEDYGWDLAVDSEGSSYVTGAYDDGTWGNSKRRLFVSKFDADGNVTWDKYSGNSSNDRGLGIAINSVGSGFICGTASNGKVLYKLNNPTISLTSPVGAEIWKASTVHNITWNTNLDGTMKIEFSIDGTNWSTLSSGITPSDRNYNFSVPNFPSISCFIRISSENYSGANSSNTIPFTITSSTSPITALTITAPNTNLGWPRGSTQNITWNVEGAVNNVKLEYTTDNGNKWTTIISSTPANSGTYSWNVPDVFSTQCKVRISDVDNPQTYDVSDIVFNIMNLSLKMPQGGDIYKAGTSQEITWESTGLGIGSLYFSTDDGVNWNLINYGISFSSGSYFWQIPAVSSENCRIKLSNDGTIFSVSPKFRIWQPVLETHSISSTGVVTVSFPTTNIDLTLGVLAQDQITVTYNSLEAPKAGGLPMEVDSTASYYWNISTGPNLSLLNGYISIPVPKLKGVTDPTKVVWLKRKTSGAAWENIGGIIKDGNLISKVPFTSFSEFSIGYLHPLPAGVSLLQPKDATGNLPVAFQLGWNPSQDAETYRVLLSKDSLFTNNLIDDSTLTSPAKDIAGLKHGMKYYWKVRAKNVAGVSNYSPVWSFITLLPAPVSLSVVSDVLKKAKLAWTDASDGESGFILERNKENETGFKTIDTLKANTVSYTDSTVQPGTAYKYRVRAYTAFTSSNYSNEVSVNTIVAPPSIPLAASPVNNAVNQPVDLPIKWHKVKDAEKYQLQVSLAQDFSSCVINDSTLSDTLKQVSSLKNSTSYFWRVRAKNAGGVSLWNEVWTFKTIVAQPSTPVLLSPANDCKSQPTDLKLSWKTLEHTAAYRIILSQDSIFANNLIDDSTLTTASKDITGLKNGMKYYWKVRAKNISGNSSWSDVWSFTTIIAKPDMPKLAYPEKTSHNMPVDLTLRWNKSQRAEKYTVQMSSDSTFGSTVFSDSSLTDTVKTMISLVNDSKYFWRVKAKNVGGESLWSEVWSFRTIIKAPEAPGLLLPENNAQDQSVGLPLKWKKLKDAEHYQLQVSTVQDFKSLVVNDTALVDTLDQVSCLNNNTSYYWRVRAVNFGGVSSWSEARTFKTIVSLPIVPVLTGPSNEASQQAIALKLSWQASQDAETYRIILSNNQLFTDNLLDDSTLTATSKEVSGLAHGMKYYWKVRAKNIAGVSSYSPVWSFITSIPSPENLNAAASGVKKIKLSWTDVSDGEAGFIIERNTDKMPDYRVIDTVQANSTSFTDSTVAFGTKYSYRLKSYTPFAVSAYSNDASVTSLTSVESWMSEIPTEYALKQNYPNPFNPSTMIRYSLPYESRVKIMIFNTLGELVSELVNKVERSGNYEKAFNAGNLPSGIYVYSITVHSTDGKNSFSSVKKMMLVK